MLEIDCRTCGNCDIDHGRCKLYGDDPQKAVQACADNGFRNYCSRFNSQSKNALINGKTSKQIKMACVQCEQGICDGCAYYFNPNCESDLAHDLYEIITRMEKRIAKQNALLAVMGITILEDEREENI